MIKIKINASDEIREVTFSRHSEHVIELGGIADAPTTGFTTWRMDGVTQLGDFSDYTTVYRTLDNAVQLSDDGSVYVEPEVPEPGEPKPTQEERIKTLENQNETLLQCILEMSERYRQVLCANSFTSLAELSLHRAGKPALNHLVAEDRERVKGSEAACEALDVNSVFCYQPASSSCISMYFMLMYFFPPHWVPAT